ncbi:hypothetical protein HDU77_006992 [Chytriomyces hyalinus]|nr:hypothetical protein HDU77_006992 [Chytriomyces hyalinus]
MVNDEAAVPMVRVLAAAAAAAAAGAMSLKLDIIMEEEHVAATVAVALHGRRSENFALMGRTEYREAYDVIGVLVGDVSWRTDESASAGVGGQLGFWE